MSTTAPAVNSVTLVGHLTADPVLRPLDENRKVCDMRLAVNDQKDQPPLFIDVRDVRLKRRGLRQVPDQGSRDRRHRPADLPRMGRRRRHPPLKAPSRRTHPVRRTPQRRSADRR